MERGQTWKGSCTAAVFFSQTVLDYICLFWPFSSAELCIFYMQHCDRKEVKMFLKALGI